MAGLLRPLPALLPRIAQGYGAKAQNLAVLARAGMPVPLTYALSASVCRRFLRRTLPGSDWPRTLLHDRVPPSPDRLRAIQARIRASALPVSLRHDLRDTLAELSARGATRWVVRSSALHEDAADASAAGLHRSMLNLAEEREVFAAILDAWASLYEPRVLSYFAALGLEGEPAVGILLQEFVPAERSGVLFTANPVTGDARELMVSASYGLTPAVTDGEVSPDVIRLDRETRAVRDAVIGAKAVQLTPEEGSGLARESVPPPSRGVPVLDDRSVGELADLGLRIEALFGRPQDIEWAWVRGRWVVLQSRPIGGLSVRVDGVAGGRVGGASDAVWSNVNVGEALPGVVTPLTWSVLSRFAGVGFTRLFHAMGVVPPEDAVFFGNFRGRIFLNMSALMAAASQVPGVGPDLIASLAGGTDLAEELRASHVAPNRASFYLRLPRTVARFAMEMGGFDARLRSHTAEFDAERARILGVDPRVLAPAALDQLLWDAERLLDRTGAVLLAGYGRLLLGLALLRTLVAARREQLPATLEQDLLTGLAELEGTAPLFAFDRAIASVRKDESLTRHLLGARAEDLAWGALPAGSGRDAIRAFLTAHGFRGPREAELSEPRWRERPELILRAVRTHLAGGALRVGPTAQERRDRRLAAERLFLQSLAAPLRAPAKRLVTALEGMLVVREQLRAQVIETLGALRAVALDASRRFEADDPRYGADAAFYLTVEELHGMLAGRLHQLVPVVEQRRRHRARDEALPAPPSTFRGRPPPSPAPPQGAAALRGLPASAGFVTGRARVARTLAEAEGLEADEILVLPSADIGWSPLFTIARGVVTELGGPLSHAAIVLREYGVPAVVNVDGATRAIAGGDLIALDGDRGIVRVLEARDGREP